MNLTIRPYEAKDQEGYWHVRDMTYRDGQSTPIEEQVFKVVKGFVAESEGKIVGTFCVLDLTCTVGHRANLKCAGICGVAVLPEYRHLGVGSEMMRWSIPYLRNEGYLMASLYGFRESFYRKFGYEMCGMRMEISAPSHRLPKLKPELPVRTIRWDEHPKLQACHEAFAKRYSGMNIRDTATWERMLNIRKTIYVAGDPVEAYAMVELDSRFWEEQHCNEIAWSTQQGHQSIIAVLSQMGINKTNIVWNEPSDSLFLQRWRDQGIEAKLNRVIMYRILDIPKSFEALSSCGGGVFSFETRDELIPENNGPWRVDDDGSKITCQKVDSADLNGSIQQWVQAYLGDPGIERGYMEEREAGAIQAAAKILPRNPVYCQEFF